MFCTDCGEKIKYTDKFCAKCGTKNHNAIEIDASSSSRSKEPTEKAAEKKSINKFALWGVIIGVISMLIVPQIGIIALILGVIALSKFNNAQKYKWMAYVAIALGVIYGVFQTVYLEMRNPDSYYNGMKTEQNEGSVASDSTPKKHRGGGYVPTGGNQSRTSPTFTEDDSESSYEPSQSSNIRANPTVAASTFKSAFLDDDNTKSTPTPTKLPPIKLTPIIEKTTFALAEQVTVGATANIPISACSYSATKGGSYASMLVYENPVSGSKCSAKVEFNTNAEWGEYTIKVTVFSVNNPPTDTTINVTLTRDEARCSKLEEDTRKVMAIKGIFSESEVQSTLRNSNCL